jgi:GNAT superfamily N-acetyltransferase
MTVREATPADADAVLAVHRASIDALGRAAYDREQVAAWRRGRSADDYALDADDRRFVVAEVASGVEDARGVVGFASLAFEAGDHLDRPADAEVVAVYVHPDAARRGSAPPCSRTWRRLRATAARRRSGAGRR